MDRPGVEKRVRRAIDMLYARDADLLRLTSSEWSVAHRLAVYIENEFAGWNVDCEYNRQGLDSNTKVRDSGGAVRPDIIVHHRGQVERAHNLLAIELKAFPTKADLAKVREYTAPPGEHRTFQYQFGLALVLSGTPLLTWFSEGEPC